MMPNSPKEFIEQFIVNASRDFMNHCFYYSKLQSHLKQLKRKWVEVNRDVCNELRGISYVIRRRCTCKAKRSRLNVSFEREIYLSSWLNAHSIRAFFYANLLL